MKKSFYFISIFILFLFNLNNVSALETNFENLSVQGYNNNGSTLTTPSVFNCSVGTCGMEITTVANSYGGAWGIQSPIPIINTHYYSVSLRIRSSNYDVTLSSKPQLSIGDNLYYARVNYQNNDYKTTLKFYRDAYNNTLQYYFVANTNASYLLIPFTTVTTTTASFMIDTIVIEDLGVEPITDQQLNNVLNNQTTIIQNNINNQTSIIQDDINNLEDNINNSLQDNFQTCNYTPVKTTNIYSYFNHNGIIDNNGSLVSNNDYVSTLFVGVQSNTTYKLINANNFNYAFYDSNQNFISYVEGNSGYFTTPSNAKFIRLSEPRNSLSSNISMVRYKKEGCTNKLDDLNDTQKETNNKLDDLNDNITDSDSSEASGEAGDFFSNFNTDTFGLTSVITAPLELIKSVTSKTCTPLQGTLPFVNIDVNLPCLSTIYENHFGTFLTIYRTITFGFVSYWVCIKIFNLVKDFKNPEHDEIEVLDL